MRIASIDAGSNTILLLIADYDPVGKSFTIIEERHSYPRLGESLTHGGTIKKEKAELSLKIMKEYREVIQQTQTEHVVAVGTNALRIAANAPEIVEQIFLETGIKIEVITGEKEAELTYLSATRDHSPGKPKGLIDIGGGSTEIVFGDDSGIGFRKSFQLGVVSLLHKYGTDDLVERKEEISHAIRSVLSGTIFPVPDGVTMFGVAGTPVTFFILCYLSGYDREKIEGGKLLLSDLERMTGLLGLMKPEDIEKKYPSTRGRSDLMYFGGSILSEVMRTLGCDSIIVSTRGLRYGALMHYALHSL